MASESKVGCGVVELRGGGVEDMRFPGWLTAATMQGWSDPVPLQSPSRILSCVAKCRSCGTPVLTSVVGQDGRGGHLCWQELISDVPADEKSAVC